MSRGKGALSGAAGGAATGAVIGGPYGAAIGGLAGGLYGYMSGGEEEKAERAKLAAMAAAAGQIGDYRGAMADARMNALNQQMGQMVPINNALTAMYGASYATPTSFESPYQPGFFEMGAAPPQTNQVFLEPSLNGTITGNEINRAKHGMPQPTWTGRDAARGNVRMGEGPGPSRANPRGGR